ncbi:putative serine/threonine-protein kinase [Porphyridium purpureum]|uniref:Putative serine/threonine-protein kinase n=1 Tax=Porphyridium purpureum TaxID=35688 RepID=A0A5J4YTB5_PORPP|nr:putative serine/threonine-protein kinase [Porphyridium purpureum]|eukprot:POR3127..scf227_4
MISGTCADMSQGPPSANSKPSGPQVGPYIFGKTLGTGSTGKVKLAKHVHTGELVAIKVIRKDFLARKPSLRKKLLREIAVMKLCDHPNVLKLYDVFEIETHLFLVIEYVDGCELFDYLVKRGSLSKDEALDFFQQIIQGLEYCHRRLICHRDMKPENLLLDRNLMLKICDFGMTNLNPPGTFLETSCGSPHYAAPEVVSGDMYNGLEADIWSLGVILYAMLTGRLPFDDDNIQRLLAKVQRGVYHLPNDMDPECKVIVRGMLNVDPAKRLTIEEIKQSAWFNSVPPKNPYEDTFVAPSEPILDPNAEVVRGLVDLGWGDTQTVIKELAMEGQSLEKVFYVQLAKHPMFTKDKTPDIAAKRKEAAADRKRAAWASMFSGQQESAQAQAAPEAGKNGGLLSPDAPLPEERISPEEAAARALEHLNVASSTGRVNAAAVRKSPSQLVRQTDVVKKANPDADSEPDKAPGGDEKSWFGNLGAIFNGPVA